MLAVSGQLDETQFGPGTLDEAMRRRSIYFMIKRSKLIPFLQVFDTPEPLASVGAASEHDDRAAGVDLHEQPARPRVCKILCRTESSPTITKRSKRWCAEAT